MDASFLNKRITIYKETTSTNSVGTPTETYSFLKKSWAGMRLLTGNTEYSQDGELPFTSVEFTVRYDPLINYKCKITYDSQDYKIKHIHPLGRKDFYRIIAIVWDEE